LHQRARAYDACGHSDWRKCWVCKQWDASENLDVDGRRSVHVICRNERRRERYRQKGMQTC
jgi:hypothetical protein